MSQCLVVRRYVLSNHWLIFFEFLDACIKERNLIFENQSTKSDFTISVNTGKWKQRMTVLWIITFAVGKLFRDAVETLCKLCFVAHIFPSCCRLSIDLCWVVVFSFCGDSQTYKPQKTKTGRRGRRDFTKMSEGPQRTEVEEDVDSQ